MRNLIVLIVIVGALAYAWHMGWIAKWFNSAVDSGIEGVHETRRKATMERPIDPAPEKR